MVLGIFVATAGQSSAHPATDRSSSPGPVGWYYPEVTPIEPMPLNPWYGPLYPWYGPYFWHPGGWFGSS